MGDASLSEPNARTAVPRAFTQGRSAPEQETLALGPGRRRRCHPRTGHATASGSHTSEAPPNMRDLWLMPLRGDRKPIAFASERFDEWGASSRPIRGGWRSHRPNQARQRSTWLRWQQPGNKKRISIGGGSTPRWRSDGRELFYASADNRAIMAVPSMLASSLVAGHRSVCLQSGGRRQRATARETSCTTSRRMVSDSWSAFRHGEPSSSRVTVVLNWAAALRP